MNLWAWTFNVKQEMVETNEKKENGKPRFKSAYKLNQVFPKVIQGGRIKKEWSGGEVGKGKLYRNVEFTDNEHKRRTARAFEEANREINRLLNDGRNLMGVVVCEKDGKYGISVCSAYEDKFKLPRGIDIARGRVVKALNT